MNSVLMGMRKDIEALKSEIERLKQEIADLDEKKQNRKGPKGADRQRNTEHSTI